MGLQIRAAQAPHEGVAAATRNVREGQCQRQTRWRLSTLGGHAVGSCDMCDDCSVEEADVLAHTAQQPQLSNLDLFFSLVERGWGREGWRDGGGGGQGLILTFAKTCC